MGAAKAVRRASMSVTFFVGNASAWTGQFVGLRLAQALRVELWADGISCALAVQDYEPGLCDVVTRGKGLPQIGRGVLDNNMPCTWVAWNDRSA